MGLFNRRTPQEIVRENKRMLDRSIRELDRERAQIEVQVKKTMAEMKKMAKAGQEVPCLCLAVLSGVGCGEDYGQGHCAHARADKQLLQDEGPDAVRLHANAG